MLHEIKRLNATIFYKSPTLGIEAFRNSSLLTFSDASQGKSSYGQTGYVSGLLLPDNSYQITDWHSSKQNHISFSSMGAEIIAAAESADRSILLSFALQRIVDFPDRLPLILTIDSHGLYSTITTLHEGKDYRLRPTVSRLRDSFESREITTIQWIAGTSNIADALTKCNPALFTKLSEVMNDGKLTADITKSFHVESSSKLSG